MAKLFLSYAREDAEKARQLIRLLKAEGHNVWWDDTIKGGESFSREIELALTDADAVLVLWSQVSVQSSWVRDEAAFGRDAGKLVPLSLDQTAPPLGFRQFQSIDLAGWSGRRKPPRFDRLIQSIAGVAGRDIESEPQQRQPRIRTHSALARTGTMASAGLLALAVAGYAVWRGSHGPSYAVAVVPSASMGDRNMNRTYAASIGSDIATLLAAQAQNASVLDASAGEPHGDDFRFTVAVAAHGPAAEASTSLSVPKERRIIWSQDWTVPDLSKTDLKQQMAFAASRALECALEGINGGLRGSLVNSYVTACAEFSAGDQPDNDLVGIFTQIVKQAPDFAPAWANLAVLYGSQVVGLIYQDRPVPADLRRQTIAAIQNARRLNPNSGKAYMAEGALAGKDKLAHLKMMERAVEVEPNTAMLHAVLAHHLRAVGRMNESIDQAQQAVALDPLSPGARAGYVRALMEGGRPAQAADELAKAQRIWPNAPSIRQAALGLNAFYGDPKRAEQLLSTVDWDEEGLARFRIFLRAREDPTAANIAATLANSKAVAMANPVNVSDYASALAMFGKTDEAFGVLRDPKYHTFVDSSTLFLPEFKQVRADPRFMAIAADAGLIKYWKVSGRWPDYCSRPGLSYDCRKEAAKYG